MKQGLDFVVIGAQKSGTTSLFEYMRRHPELALPAGKEVPYFSHDRACAEDFASYLRKSFAFADPRARWGTVTPHYMVGGLYQAGPDAGPERGSPTAVPARIHRRLPEARIVAILRDPVERARSHHAMALMNGWDERPFEQAMLELLEPDALEAARAHPQESTGYITWGEYGRILDGYLEVFPREQMLVLFTSELKADPGAVLRRLFAFLGVAPDFVPDNLGTTYRPSGANRRMSWLDLNVLQAAVADSHIAKRLWHALPEPTRRRMDDRFNRLNYWLDLWNRRNGTNGPEAAEEEAISALREHFGGDARRLATSFDVRPPWLESAVLA